MATTSQPASETTRFKLGSARWRLEDSMHGTELERFEKSGERMNRVKLVPGIYLVVLLGPQNRKDKITERLDFAADKFIKKG